MADSKDGKVPSEPPPSYEKTSRAVVPVRPVSGAPRPGPKPIDIPILRYLRSKRVVLASASPRRKALLGLVGLTNLEIRPSTKPEDIDKASHTADEYVSATAHQKCLDVYAAIVESQATSSSDPDPTLVLAADTVVVSREGRILEKPRDRADHIRMLRLLRDSRVHRVLTAVVALSPREDLRSPGYELASHVEDTSVFFARESEGLPDDVIEAYVDTREGCDKAGGYALQGIAGSMLVERVEGSVDNVVGLPVRKCLELAEKVVFRQHVDEDADEEEEE